MVARLAGLKLRLLWNGLRADWQRRIGLPATVGLLAAGSYALAQRYLDAMDRLPVALAADFSLWAALGFAGLWITLPVVVFPLDENLDPAQFALAPVPPPRLVAGLGAAALVAPSVIVPLIVLTANAVAFSEVLWAGILSGVLMLALLVVSGQLFTTVISAILRTRRGRDLTMLIVVGIGLVGFSAQQLVRQAVHDLGLAGAVAAHPISGVVGVLPPLAAQRVVTEAALGRPLGAVGYAVVTAGWIVGLSWLWHRLLQWMLTTPEAHAGPRRRAWTARLTRGGVRGPRSAMVGKELRFYLRDPRQRLVWTGAVIFIGLAGASILVGTGGLALFRSQPWLPLLAPGLVLFVGLPIALNVFGWERNAASFLFVLPGRPRELLVGKNLAALVALTVETAVMSVLLAWLSGGWEMLGFVPALTLCAVGCQMAVGNLVSVTTPLRLPREGTDVFSQATEQGCLAIVAQLVSFFLIGVLLVVPSSVMVLTVGFGSVIAPWVANTVAVTWGALAYLLSLLVSGWILKRRIPEIVSWVEVV